VRLLLDTHTLIWLAEDSPRLGRGAAEAIASEINKVMVSSVSAMEITLKFRLGKLPNAEPLARAFETEISAAGFIPLPVTLTHAALAGSLDIAHKDPFDRLLIAQAMIEDMTLVSNEAIFDGFGVKRLW
jgi:PIN domain nuclease of toxin-antitoxin system